MTKQEEHTQGLLESLAIWARYQDGWSFDGCLAASEQTLAEAEPFCHWLPAALGEGFEYDLTLLPCGALEFSVFVRPLFSVHAMCSGQDKWETYDQFNYVFNRRRHWKTTEQVIEELKRLLA
jgi:hypothetical protein